MSSSTIHFYRVFDQNGNKLSTAIFQGSSFLQLKPRRATFQTQMDWIQSVTNNGQTLFTISCEQKARPKPWAEMTQQERKAHEEELNKKALDRMNKKMEEIRASRQAESPFVKLVRAYYDQYNLPNSLTLKAFYITKANPKLHTLTREGDIVPVFFNRKSGVVLHERRGKPVDPSQLMNPFVFYIQRYWGMEKAILEKEDLRQPVPGQKVIGFTYLNYWNSEEVAKKMVTALESSGYLVKQFLCNMDIDYFRKEVIINHPELDYIMNPSTIGFSEGKVTVFNPKEFNLSSGDWNLKPISLSSWIHEHASR